MGALSFARPWALLALALTPLAGWLLWRRRTGGPRLALPTIQSALAVRRSTWVRLWWLPGALLALALGLVVLGLAGPRLRGLRPPYQETNS